MKQPVQVSIAERNQPFFGEALSGDLTLCVPCNGNLFLAIADGLGHGPAAHEVVVNIERFLREQCSTDLAGLAQRLHTLLRGTRGAAAGLAYLDVASGSLAYVGIGNTRLRRYGAEGGALSSQPGTLGHQIRTPVQQTLQLAPGDLLILSTDGVSERLDREADAALLAADVQSVAAGLIHRYGKTHDDASCIVLRYGGG